MNSLKQLTNVPKGSMSNSIKLLALFFFTLCSLNLISLTVSAQFAGWTPAPSAFDHTTTKTTSTTEYIDGNRARITSATHISGTQYSLTVTAPTDNTLCGTVSPYTPGLSFPTGKWLLLIQMEDQATSGNLTGVHCRAEVVSFNCGTGTLVVNIPTGNTWPGFDFSSTSRVQALRVTVYENLDLNPKGQITCSPYSHTDGTGGIVALFVNGILNFNGGIINAAGKGYDIGWVDDEADLGEGGSGAPHNPAYSSSGVWPGGPHGWAKLPVPNGEPEPAGLDNTVHGYYCSNSPGANANIDFNSSSLTNGQDGGDQNTSYSSGTSTNFSDVIHYDVNAPTYSSSWGVLRMGQAGDPGTDGGHGAGGGGIGGDGGSNNLGTGFPGSNGGDGGLGGDVGKSTPGGGIVLLKVKAYAEATTAIGPYMKYIVVNGAYGKHGTYGDDGGSGGDGGIGSNGDCDFFGKIVPPGGTGGYGESGTGAQGGDGGDGGKPGTIWLMKKPGSSPSSLKSRCAYYGGWGGGGGNGGYSKKWYDLPIQNNWNSPLSSLPCNVGLDYYYCPPTPTSPPVEVCDCDEVFRQLGEDMVNLNITNNSGYPYEISSTLNLFEDKVYFTDNYKGQPTLYYTNTSGTPITRYNCFMYRGSTFVDMMDKMYAVDKLETYAAPGTYTFNNTDVGVNLASYNATTADVELKWDDSRNSTGLIWDVFYYESEYTHGQGKLIDEDNPAKRNVIDGNCTFVYKSVSSGGSGSSEEYVPQYYYEVTGESGDDGDDAPDGTENNEFYEDDDVNVPAPPPHNERKNYFEFADLFEVSINEDANGLSLKANPEVGGLDYSIFSISGQLILTGQFENSTTIENVASGMYVIICKNKYGIDSKKIIKD